MASCSRRRGGGESASVSDVEPAAEGANEADGPFQPPGRRPGDSFMSQSMMAEGSGASAPPSGARDSGLRPRASRLARARRPPARVAERARAGGLIARVTGFSRIAGLSRGTTTRGLDAVGRAGIAACASIGAALTGARRSGSATRSASPDGTGLDGASARGRVTTTGAGASLVPRGGLRWARGVVGGRPRRVVAQAREPPREVGRARDEERGGGDGHVEPTAPLGARVQGGRARRRSVEVGKGRRRRDRRSPAVADDGLGDRSRPPRAADQERAVADDIDGARRAPRERGDRPDGLRAEDLGDGARRIEIVPDVGADLVGAERGHGAPGDDALSQGGVPSSFSAAVNRVSPMSRMTRGCPDAAAMAERSPTSRKSSWPSPCASSTTSSTLSPRAAARARTFRMHAAKVSLSCTGRRTP